MRKSTSAFFVALGIISLLGCSTQPNLPLIFGQSHAVGINIAGNATEGGAELTIGYKDRDIAIVPVTVEQADGSRTQLDATVGKVLAPGQQSSGPDIDAFSVLGQFEVRAESGGQVKAGLGKFFATGIAARRLADGFAGALSEAEREDAVQPQATATNR